MNYIKDIELKNNDITYNTIIEIPKGTNIKYELDEIKFDKLNEVRKVKGKYPFYYGCFPQTLADDKDALDMILLTNKKFNKLDIVKVQIIGVIKTIDNNEVDDKILVIPKDELIKNIQKLENKALKFLARYKGKKTNMILDKTIYDTIEAIKLIKEANLNYLNKNKKETVRIKSF